jgi:hypothetical protein
MAKTAIAGQAGGRMKTLGRLLRKGMMGLP